MTIENNLLGANTRSRIGKASAVHYSESRRVILIADEASFADAEEALRELRDAVDPSEYVQTCVDCNRQERQDDI